MLNLEIWGSRDMAYMPLSLHSAVQRIKTASILAPLLALTAICGSAALLATIVLGDSLLAWVLWSAFLLCVIASLSFYIYWSIRDPDRLQTEDYLLARRKIDLIGDERGPPAAKLIDESAISNPMIGEVE